MKAQMKKEKAHKMPGGMMMSDKEMKKMMAEEGKPSRKVAKKGKKK